MATPIDFQILYTQSTNVAQNLSGQQNAIKFSEYSQQQLAAQKNLENSKKVQQSSMEKNTSINVNADGRNGSPGYRNSSNKNTKNDAENTNNESFEERVKEAHLGNIIDITS